MNHFVTKFIVQNELYIRFTASVYKQFDLLDLFFSALTAKEFDFVRIHDLYNGENSILDILIDF